VVVVASINVDLVVTVDRLPNPGETVAEGGFSRHWGGKGANQAVAAARYGAQVDVLGAVGDDEFGAGAVAALDGEGIGTEHIAVLEDAATGVALIVIDRAGENQIAVASGANARVATSALPTPLAGASPGVVLTTFEVPGAAVLATLEAARTAGWTAVVNPAPGRDLDVAFAGSGAILTPNRRELAAIAGPGDPERAARRIVDEVTGAPVVVTLGEEGALLVRDDGTEHVRPPVVGPVDTTGAGDAFNGVLAAALAEGDDLTTATRTAVAAASFSTEVLGARAGMLDRGELVRRLSGPV
jgi:ribokinase